MKRSRSALAGALVSSALLGGCVGGGDATQGGIRDKVEERLIEDGYIPSPEADSVALSPEEAATVADCVSRTMFESTDEWTKDERNAVNRSSDGDPPDPELLVQLTELIRSCVDEARPAAGPDAPDEGDEESTTTTEGDEESTTTTEG